MNFRTIIMKPSKSSALLSLFLFVTGCSGPSSSTHTVGHDQDQFTEEVDGRKVEYRNWTIMIEGKLIPIEKKESVIKIDYNGEKVDIFVNGKQVHDE